ncbi:hypothetical protein MMC07_006581 [Pseudocyphellaria aurata]|nr:hypothetical protein [Pseudocyphellaria aurata]
MPSLHPSLSLGPVSLDAVSTAEALLTRPEYQRTTISIVDCSTPIPFSDHNTRTSVPTTASLDSSRIIRADYSSPFYAALAAAASARWRSSPLFSPHYHGSGVALTCTPSDPPTAGEKYVQASLANVRALESTSSDIEILSSSVDIQRVMQPAGGSYGSNGYVNSASGWADASGAMEALREHVHELGLAHRGFRWVKGTVAALTYSSLSKLASRVTGARLASGVQLTADLTVLAAGAWSGKYLNLQGRVQATAQTVAYVQLEPDEAREWARTPVLLHTSSGFFLIPPTPDNVLKIARHSHGWLNEIQIPHPEPPSAQLVDESGHSSSTESFIRTSLPAADFATLPPSSIGPLRDFLAACVPSLVPRLAEPSLFSATRVCWYADTPTGDFLVDYAPQYGRSLFVATGGSGHAFKFLPVLGEKVVERMTKSASARCAQNGKAVGEDLWRWRETLGELGGDDSRGGEKGLKWGDEKWN